MNRQTEYGGFNGRANKHVDGCYTFWACGSLCLLNPIYLSLVEKEMLEEFVFNCCQDEDGLGLRDKPDVEPDSYHSCYVLGGWMALQGLMENVELAM